MRVLHGLLTRLNDQAPHCTNGESSGKRNLEAKRVVISTVGMLTHLNGISGTGGISTVLVLWSADFEDGAGEVEFFRLLPKNASGSSFLFALVGVTDSSCGVEEVDGVE